MGASRISAATCLAACLVALVVAAAPRAAATTAESISRLALANVGHSAGVCAEQPILNSLGGADFDGSCGADHEQPEYWCADFVRWVWAHAGDQGIDTQSLSAGAGSFYTYGLTHPGSLHSSASYRPRVGDAAVYAWHGDGTAEHVALVVGVSADGSLDTVSGDWGGGGSPHEADFARRSSVVELTVPADQAAAGHAVDALDGLVLSAFVTPAEFYKSAVFNSRVTNMFRTYADSSGAWNGGERSMSTLLPDGRVLWLFGDTSFGPVNADGTKNWWETSSPHQSLLIQSRATGNVITSTITGPLRERGSSLDATSPFTPPPPIGANESEHDFLRPEAITTEGATVLATFSRMHAVRLPGPGLVRDQLTAVATDVASMPVASIADPQTYTVTELASQPDCAEAESPDGSACTSWGYGLLESDDCVAVSSPCTYIYGLHPHQPEAAVGSLRIAVAPRGQLMHRGSWRYLTDHGWSAAEAGISDLIGGISTGGVDRWHGHYVLVTLEADSEHSGQVVAYYADHPYAFSPASKTPLFTAPVPGDPGTSSIGHYTDQYRLHPALDSGGHLVLGYSVHSTAVDNACMSEESTYDDYIDQPRFYDIALPADPDPAASPVAMPPAAAAQLTHHARVPMQGMTWHDNGAADVCDASPAPPPTGLTAASDRHGVHLRWRDSGGMFWYFIERCNADASGCADESRWSGTNTALTDRPCPDAPTWTCVDAPSLTLHAKVLLRVRAATWTGVALSAPSNVARVTVLATRPPKTAPAPFCRERLEPGAQCTPAIWQTQSVSLLAPCQIANWSAIYCSGRSPRHARTTPGASAPHQGAGLLWCGCRPPWTGDLPWQAHGGPWSASATSDGHSADGGEP